MAKLFAVRAAGLAFGAGFAALGAGLDGAAFALAVDFLGVAFLAFVVAFDLAGPDLAGAFTGADVGDTIRGALGAVALAAAAFGSVEVLSTSLITGHCPVAKLAANALRSRNIDTTDTLGVKGIIVHCTKYK
ncbi:hypothetical protein [uncultured Maricaulis sp.]|uniref:hypothetical protein n=1 Tax=uncultured Maricaulis sp. TaxID=174710 RepID=UPI002629EB4E|nr:hypothetical protein [uncultured Maricaulis sp.]